MNKFPVDFSSLEKQVNKKKAFRLSEVADKIEKVAFDVVRFKDVNDKNIAGLWQIQSSDDGEVIVAVYEEPTEKGLEVNSSWNVMSDRSGKNLSIFYKTTPVTKVAVADLGIPDGDVDLLCRHLPETLASNEKLVESLLSDLPNSHVRKIASAHPELGLAKKAQNVWFEAVYKLKNEQEEKRSVLPHPTHAEAAQEMNQIQMEHGPNLEYAFVRERGYN